MPATPPAAGALSRDWVDMLRRDPVSDQRRAQMGAAITGTAAIPTSEGRTESPAITDDAPNMDCRVSSQPTRNADSRRPHSDGRRGKHASDDTSPARISGS